MPHGCTSARLFAKIPGMKMKACIASALLVFSTGIPLRAADLSDLSYEVNGDAVTITDCDTAATGTLVIPATLGDKPVTGIGIWAFYNCTALTKTSFGKNSHLTRIEANTFNSCTSLASIHIPEGVTSIGGYAFNHCRGLTSQVRSHTSWARIGN